MGCGVLFPRDFESRFALHGRSWLFAHDEFKMYLLRSDSEDEGESGGQQGPVVVRLFLFCCKKTFCPMTNYSR